MLRPCLKHFAPRGGGGARDPVAVLPREGAPGSAIPAFNPEGKVPTLVIDGQRVLTEVAGILFYLARRFPEPALMPWGEPEAEAQVVSWMSFLAATVHPARRLGADHAKAVWGMGGRRLGGGGWGVGGAYSVADIHLFRLFWRFRGAVGLEQVEYPGLFAHHDRMMGRAAVKRAIEVEAGTGYELPGEAES